jgi:bacterial DNA-binding protein
MTKAELIKRWKEDENEAYTAAQLDVLLKSLCSVIATELFEGGEAALPALGKLTTVRGKGRDYRNVHTGEKYHVPTHLRAVFRPSKAFKELLN